jgi:hypothetical protein
MQWQSETRTPLGVPKKPSTYTDPVTAHEMPSPRDKHPEESTAHQEPQAQTQPLKATHSDRLPHTVLVFRRLQAKPSKTHQETRHFHSKKSAWRVMALPVLTAQQDALDVPARTDFRMRKQKQLKTRLFEPHSHPRMYSKLTPKLQHLTQNRSPQPKRVLV